MKEDRRKFIKQTALGSLMMTLGPGMVTSCDSKSRLDEIGLIGGVIRDELKNDWEGTLRKVASIGYNFLEHSGYFGDDINYFKSFMKEVGLQSKVAGSAMSSMMDTELLKKMIAEELDLGKEYLTCYWPWLDDGTNKNLDDFKLASERLNEIGKVCKEGGIRFSFHNHDKEFVPVEGHEFGYDVMLKETDPKYVAMQLDLYWITKGGGDPIKVLKEHGNRIELFHVKDMDQTKERGLTCPGYGIIDFAAIFSEAKEVGVKYYIVEIDRHESPIQCIEDSYKYLSELRF